MWLLIAMVSYVVGFVIVLMALMRVVRNGGDAVFAFFAALTVPAVVVVIGIIIYAVSLT